MGGLRRARGMAEPSRQSALGREPWCCSALRAELPVELSVAAVSPAAGPGGTLLGWWHLGLEHIKQHVSVWEPHTFRLKAWFPGGHEGLRFCRLCGLEQQFKGQAPSSQKVCTRGKANVEQCRVSPHESPHSCGEAGSKAVLLLPDVQGCSTSVPDLCFILHK